MSCDLALGVYDLSKCYEIYSKPQDRLKQIFMRGRRRYYSEFWAVRDVSFEVNAGETVGIIGRNGSGKSTLLQLLCGIVTPTSGEVKRYGRVAALLELGAGFNAEFTGKENVYMSGAILGLTRAEVDRRYDDIVAFADIGDFIHQPVKTYSSGMFVRLAFSVAVNVEPDILVVDEALAVGDILFQAKCMIRMKRMIDNGVTVLFVSHDMGMVKGLCQKSVFLEEGRLVGFGKSVQIVDNYLETMNRRLNRELAEQIETSVPASSPQMIDAGQRGVDPFVADIQVSTGPPVSFPLASNRYGDGGIQILDICLLNSARQPSEQIAQNETFYIQVAVSVARVLPTFAVGYSIRDLRGLMVVGTMTTCEDVTVPAVNPGDVYVFEIQSKNSLNQGVYTISVGIELPIVFNQQHIFLDIVENAIVFKSGAPASPREAFHTMVRVPAKFSFVKAK